MSSRRRNPSVRRRHYKPQTGRLRYCKSCNARYEVHGQKPETLCLSCIEQPPLPGMESVKWTR